MLFIYGEEHIISQYALILQKGTKQDEAGLQDSLDIKLSSTKILVFDSFIFVIGQLTSFVVTVIFNVKRNFSPK